MNNKNIIWIIGIIAVIFIVFNMQKGSTQSGVCIQVITPACNPTTNQIQDFPTPCDVPAGWTTSLSQCNAGTPIKRAITILSDKIEVMLTINGNGRFGGIIKENIPSGLQVQGITNINLGASGSATGKLTGNVYEIAFIVDNTDVPSITYTLSKPSDNVAYGLLGNFEFAQGFLGGCKPNGDYGSQQQEIISLCSQYSTQDTCIYSSGTQTQGELCTWYSSQGIIGGDKQIFKCIKKCIRPSNLCASASSIPDECGSVCTGLWTIRKRTDADLNCNNFVENTELLGSINYWVSDTPPFNDNIILLQIIGAWVKSAGCTKDEMGIWTCPTDGG